VVSDTASSGTRVLIREALGSDLDDVMAIERAAFGSHEEADLVGDLVADSSAAPLVSLLAFRNGRAVGHILFTRLGLEAPAAPAMSILAPLAVVPDCQRQGIGSRLVERGFQVLAERGIALVFVLGYPGYYRRFGFRPAAALGFDAPYPIAPRHADAWMVRELQPGVIGTCAGRVVCADSLSRPQYWRE